MKIFFLKDSLMEPPIPLNETTKSNLTLYQSYDRRFILKCITKEDVEQIHHILPEYHRVCIFKDIDLVPFFVICTSSMRCMMKIGAENKLNSLKFSNVYNKIFKLTEKKMLNSSDFHRLLFPLSTTEYDSY